MFFQFKSLSQEVIVFEIGKKKVRCPSFWSIRSYLWVIIAIRLYILGLLQLLWKKNHKRFSSSILRTACSYISLKFDSLYRTRLNTRNKNEKMKLKAKCCSTECGQQDNFYMSNHQTFKGILQPTKKDQGLVPLTTSMKWREYFGWQRVT